MTAQSSRTLARLTARAERLAISVDGETLSRLADYFDLLQRWNEKINLTSLGDTDEAIDRLIMEPLVAVRFLPRSGRLIDIGSGGGSPAIPLSIALRSSSLTMVESRSRKGAFLREALRSLELSGSVEERRAETLAESPEFSGSADIVSMRAVRMTPSLSSALSHLLSASGVLAMFSKHSEPIPDGFKPAGAHELIAVTQSFLHRFTPIR